MASDFNQAEESQLMAPYVLSMSYKYDRSSLVTLYIMYKSIYTSIIFSTVKEY